MSEVTPVFGEDYDLLSTFLAEFPGVTRTKDLWRDRLVHWWDNNPAFSGDIPRGWVIRDADRIVGFLGNIPSLFRSGGRNIIAFSATNWRVLPAYRGQSLELRMRLIAAARDSILFQTTPNDSVVVILEGLKFELMPGVDQRRSYVITSLEKKIREKLKLGPTLRPVFRLLTVPLRWVPTLRIGRVSSEPGLTVRNLDHAGAEFDDLWERTKDQFEATSVRTARVLGWYCFTSPFRKKELFGCYRNGQLVGYAICLVNRTTRLGSLECIDLWTESADSGVTKALILELKEFGRRNRYGVVLVPHFSSVVEEMCAKAGMLIREAVYKRRYMRAASELLPTIHGPSCYFVVAQGDYAL